MENTDLANQQAALRSVFTVHEQAQLLMAISARVQYLTELAAFDAKAFGARVAAAAALEEKLYRLVDQEPRAGDDGA